MPEDHANTTVLVTGASGFLGLHCVLQLLQKGYRVRGTVRSQGRADEVRAAMEANAEVASAHIAAMTAPGAAGQRFCCAIEFSWIGEVADILAKRFGPEGWKVPTRNLPNFMVRVVAMFDRTVKTVVSDLGKVRRVSSDRIRSMLNWQPHSLEEMVVSMGETMIQQGIVSR